MTWIKPTMTPDEAIARADVAPWVAGTLVWATCPTNPSGKDLEWVPGRVLGPSGMGERAREVEAQVYGGREMVHRDDAELLLRYVSEERRAVIRKGPGLAPESPVYAITYLHDGKEVGRSLARGDEIDAWRADLRAEGYLLEE